MLGALGDSQYSGYVRLLAPRVSAIILLRSGRVVDSLCREGEAVETGEAALRAVERLVGRGEGVLDIVGLSPDLVDGLHHLAAGEATYPELVACWVNITGLVDFLKKRGFTGSLTVQAAADSGVILFVAGAVTGAFNQAARSISETADEVCALCEDPDAIIVVRAAAAPAVEPEPRFRAPAVEVRLPNGTEPEPGPFEAALNEPQA